MYHSPNAHHKVLHNSYGIMTFQLRRSTAGISYITLILTHRVHAICQVLGINWNQVQEKHIKNKEVRALLCNILNIDVFITRRTATYLGKILRSDNSNYRKVSYSLDQPKKKKWCPPTHLQQQLCHYSPKIPPV